MKLFIPSKLIVRLDDACSTMRRDAWDAVEQVFGDAVKPIVGVIPDCQDSTLRLEPEDPGFWRKVRVWRDKGWLIAMHGETHVHRPAPSGDRGLVPFHVSGEYNGRPLEEQRRSIHASWDRFVAEGIRPEIFMAPRHAFDLATLKALELETDIRWVTDGISWRPFVREGFGWLPQQYFALRKPPPWGVWTACLHPNTMSTHQLSKVSDQLAELRRFVVDPRDVMRHEPAAHGALDRLFELGYWRIAALRAQIKRSIGWTRRPAAGSPA